MKAVMQNFRNGEMSITDVPPPALKPGGVLVRNVASLVSAGTEKAVIGLARMNPLQKARSRPDLVKKVLNRAGQEGLIGTAQIVMNLVSTPLPLGYSCAGIVEAVGEGVTDLHPGDRVACAGLGYANHAEVVFVPRNLTTKIPDEVSFEEAAFVTVGAIALHGVRQANLQLGENVVIIGLGLLGQLTVQICKASGCRVFGTDLDPQKVALALEMGMDAGQTTSEGDITSAVKEFTRQRGADAVIITAATSSSEPVHLAAQLARDRARVVAVGDVGLDIPRRDYYEKEIDLRLSRSYGPGRYDPLYEEGGVDYPIGYVRWTENRNMEAFLDLIAARQMNVERFITHRYAIENAMEAYSLLDGKEPYIGIMLQYAYEKPQATTVHVIPAPMRITSHEVRFGIIGAGQFAQGILLPKLKSIEGVRIKAVATGQGITARRVAEKYEADFCTSDYQEILARPEIDAVLIATRHHLHASMVIDALKAGKHVFVEKPLALTPEALQAIQEAYQESLVLMTGFNRRFSPLAEAIRQTQGGQPMVMNYRVNAGAIPATSWQQDPMVGGGRIVGEVCHFIDLMQYFTDAAPVEIFASALGDISLLTSDPDNIAVQIRFSDGSLGTLNYVANGTASFPKEQITVFGGGRVGVLDNWRSVRIIGRGKPVQKNARLMAAKGHKEELVAFVEGLRKGESPISFESQRLTTQATFAIQQSLRTGQPVPVE